MGKKGKKGGGKAAAAAPQLSPALLTDVPAAASSTAEDEEDAALHAELALTTELLLQVCALCKLQQSASFCANVCESLVQHQHVCLVWKPRAGNALVSSSRNLGSGRLRAQMQHQRDRTTCDAVSVHELSSRVDWASPIPAAVLRGAAERAESRVEAWEPPQGDGALRGTPCVLGDGDLSSNSAFQFCLRRS